MTRLLLILLLVVLTACITVTVGGRDASTKQSSDRSVDIDKEEKKQ